MKPPPALTPLLDAMGPGDHVYIAGSAGEPAALLAAWKADPERTKGLAITTSAVPGINRFEIDSLHPSAVVTGLFMQPGFARAQREGKYRHLPVSYAGFAGRLQDPGFSVDVCVVQVAPPGPDGRCSMGLAVEFMPLVLARSKRIIGLLNSYMPSLAGSPSIGRSSFFATAEVEVPLPCYETGEIGPLAHRIAAHVAAFIDDGAALQLGLGKIPAALAGALADRKGLKLQSGMLGDGFRHLAGAGALDPSWRHQACVVVGSQALYDWAPEFTHMQLAGCEITHDLAWLAATNGLIAVNSALEIDLFGQANLEHADGAAVSGCGGAPDFARAARSSRHGVSIIALPATFATPAASALGRRSRIRGRISAPHLVSLARHDIDIVVTEYGAADLRGRSVHEIAAALIAIAHPDFRAALAEQWDSIARQL